MRECLTFCADFLDFFPGLLHDLCGLCCSTGSCGRSVRGLLHRSQLADAPCLLADVQQPAAEPGAQAGDQVLLARRQQTDFSNGSVSKPIPTRNVMQLLLDILPVFQDREESERDRLERSPLVLKNDSKGIRYQTREQNNFKQQYRTPVKALDGFQPLCIHP